ncbi:MAG TPA: TadE/TadG family type IV pilus assembly protein [Chloroflexota bacterium]
MAPRASVPGLWRRAASAEEGAAAVEMAVSMTALLMVIVGMMKMCLAVYSYHYTSEAAREGARYAIVRGSSASSSSTACVNYETGCVATSDNISAYVKALGYPALTPANMTVSVTWVGFPTGVTCSPSATCNNPGNMVTVTVQYSFPLQIPFRTSKTLTMTSTSSGIIAQ